MKTIDESIIDTLSYFDIFNYPLTLKEVQLFLHDTSPSQKSLDEIIKKIPVIEKKGTYFYLKGRKNTAYRRKILKRINKEKLNLGVRYANLLGIIPGVMLVALTGSVSMENASENDDIDIFIITKKNMLWICRFLAVFMTKIFGIKREYKSKISKNKLCLNMFLDESAMEMSEKNLYTAHEIVQMKVCYNKSNTYKKLYDKNPWIKKYFPNLYVKNSEEYKKRGFMKLNDSLKILNSLFFLIQYLYMAKKITNEEISLTKAFFHTNNLSKFIVEEHKKRSKHFNDLNSKLVSKEKFEAKSIFGKKGGIIN